MSTSTFTFDVRNEQQSSPPQQNSQPIQTHFPADKIPLGLTKIDIKHGTGDYCIRSYIDSVEPAGDAYNATVHIDTWHQTVLRGAGCTWFDVSKWDKEFQFGRILATHRITNASDQTYDITFDRPFDEPPKVVVWIHTLNIDRKQDMRIHAYAPPRKITTTGFKLEAHTWEDTVIYDSKISWLAVPSNWPNVTAGTYQDWDMENPQSEYKTDVTFDKPFSRPPRVLVALNKFHASHEHDLCVETRAENITAKGATLSIRSWGDTKLYQGGFDYLAIED